LQNTEVNLFDICIPGKIAFKEADSKSNRQIKWKNTTIASSENLD